MRAAIQTTVNGANLTDTRLSGVGVSACNYNTGAPASNTGNLGVTFTAASAGALAPLSGQVINLRSNFDNIADQKLNIVLGAGATAYNAAVGSVSSPVQVANQRIGGTNSATLVVANNTTAGSFSEDLNASLGTITGAVSGTGNITGRLAGSNTGAGAITVGVNTVSAGAKTGTVTLNYETAGTVNSVNNSLGAVSVGSQLVTINGNVYQAATGAIQSAALNFGTVQVGQSVSQNLVIRNTATGPNGFVEDLNASFASFGSMRQHYSVMISKALMSRRSWKGFLSTACRLTANTRCTDIFSSLNPCWAMSRSGASFSIKIPACGPTVCLRFTMKSGVARLTFFLSAAPRT